MPYCPKCDMEFVEGVTVCTDCGGPLVESKEAAMAAKREEEKRRAELFARRYGQMLKEAEAETAGEDSEGSSDRPAARRESAHAYVDKSQRYEDMRSSASAFFIVGGILAAAAVLGFLGVIPIPAAGPAGLLFKGLLAVMAAASLAVGFSSKKSAKTLRAEAADEKKKTGEILDWFTENWSGEDLDNELHAEDAELEGEELALKRFELIQDRLITGRDLPDPSYVDALCDSIYSRLYGDR